MARKRSRLILTIGAVAIVGAGLTLAFLPHPTMVDMGVVDRGPMMVTINEEGQTQVRNPYVVSAPISGRLLRLVLRPGDAVVQNETVVAYMLPANPAALDARSREQASASLDAASAALRLAQANLARAIANQKLADSDLARTQQLVDKGLATRANLDSVSSAAGAASAAVAAAEADIAAREADLANARALLTGFSDSGAAAGGSDEIPLLAPATGRVLQVMQQSATTLAAGAPIMQIGDIAGDLEVAVALLSTDAVQVEAGDRVLIENWGGAAALTGTVARLDPNGFTKASALGVEEQRVNIYVDFNDPPASRAGLGNGFRVEVRIVVWEDNDALIVPSSALFRDGGAWATFVVVADKAVLRHVEVGRDNGIEAEVLDGLAAGDRVVLYPSSTLTDGQTVAQRVVG